MTGITATSNAQELLPLIPEDPYRKPPPFQKLAGDLAGACALRINMVVSLAARRS
jgi:toxin YoeB